MAGKLVYDFLGGIRFIYYNHVYERYEIQLGPLARWLFGFALIFLVVGMVLARERQMEMFVVVRYGKKRLWWSRHFLFCVVSGLEAALIYWMILHGLDRGLGLVAEEPVAEVRILLLWIVHVLTMICMYCFLDRTRLSGIAVVALLMIETLTIVAAFYAWNLSDFMFGTWGMYMQSEWVDMVNGFSVLPVLAAECGMMALCFLGGLRRMQRKDWSCQEDQNGTCH